MMRSCPLRIVSALLAPAAALALALPSVSVAEILYDIDFESPPHLVGSPPVVGTDPPPRDRPTEIRFGEPIVVAGMAGMAQCLRFDSFCCPYGGDQIVLDFQGLPPHAFYRAGFGVTIESIETGAEFSALFDSPFAYNVAFYWENGVGGVIEAGFPGQEVPVGSWQPEVPIRVAAEMWTSGSWTVFLDGVAVHDGPWGSGLGTIRFGTGVSGIPLGVTAGLDNIFVWGGEGPVGVDESSWAELKSLHR